MAIRTATTNRTVKHDCTECIVDIIAYTWDVIKYILVYCGIYLNLYTCVHINRNMIIRGSIIRFTEININQSSELKSYKQDIRFTKLLIYYWSSKYTDKDFDTFIYMIKRHIGSLMDASFTLVLNITLPQYKHASGDINRQIHNVCVDVNLSKHTVSVKHMSNNSVLCVHDIEDSYGFDLFDILDFAIGRSICPSILS